MNCIPADVNTARTLHRYHSRNYRPNYSARNKISSHTEGSNYDGRTKVPTHTSGHFIACEHGQASLNGAFAMRKELVM